jgi:hypothetical protein
MIKTEKFNKPCLPFEPESLLPEGCISAGKNMQRAGLLGGWKPRRGCTLVNTTAVSGGIDELFFYKHPRRPNEGHLIAQAGSNLKTNNWASGTISTDQFATFANTINKDSDTSLYWSAVVGEDMILIGDGKTPLVFSGEGCRPEAFLTQASSSDDYIDQTLAVTVSDENKVATIPAGASCAYYVCFKAPITKLVLEIGTANTDSVTLQLWYWYNGTWTAASVTTDGTDGTETHDQDGTITFSTGNSPEMTVLNNQMGYWYKVNFSAALTSAVTIDKCNGKYATNGFEELKNKWDSNFRYVQNAQFYNQSVGLYQDIFCKVTDGINSTYLDLGSATTSDFLYFKTGEPICGIGFIVPTDYENTGAGNFDLLEGLSVNGSGTWGTIGTAATLTDETLEGGGSLAQSGTVWLEDLDYTQSRAVFAGDSTPGYWYRISWDVAMSANVRITGMLYASKPDDFPSASGCMELDGRLVLWGNEEYPNRLIRSAYGKPDHMCNIVEKYTVPFGGEDKIKCCTLLGNVVFVFKEQETYVINRDFEEPNLIANVGIASPKTLAVANCGVKILNTEESLSVALWQAYDGIYIASSSGYIKKISEPIREYFDPQKSSYIGKANIDTLSGFYSPLDCTYRLLLPSTELVYSVTNDEWFPYWKREMILDCGIVILNEEEEYVLLGAGSDGLIMHLDEDTTDKTTANADKKIEHEIETRAIPLDEQMSIVSGYLRGLWAHFKEDIGNITVTIYVNYATTGVEENTPDEISLSNSDVTELTQLLQLSQSDVSSFKIKFSSSMNDQSMEIYSLTYWTESFKLYEEES